LSPHLINLPYSSSSVKIGALWKDAPENPKRGQEVKEKDAKAPKRSKKTTTKVPESDEGPQVEPGSDE
jgi:hypothetical protein